MGNYTLVSNMFLRGLCIRENWFTCGTCEQYDKLFELNRNGATLEELALVIWLCSDDCWNKDTILLTLCLAKKDFLDRINGCSE